MNKAITAFIFGALISGGVTYYITENILKKKYDRELDKRIREELAKYNDIPETVEETEETEQEEKPLEVVDVKETKKVESINTSVVDYKKMAGQYAEEKIKKDPSEMTEEEWYEEAMKPKLSEDDPLPYVITEEEHETTNIGYDCEELTYNVLAQELYYDISGQTIETGDIESVIGMKNFNDFVHDNTRDEMYVRNEGWVTDYVVRKDIGK